MKRNLRNRLDRLEDTTDGISIEEYWVRDIDDSLEDPTEPWETVFQGGSQ